MTTYAWSVVSAPQVMTVLVQAGALQLCSWPGLSGQELAGWHMSGTARLPVACERWSWHLPAESLCLRSWPDPGLQPGCCACGKSESSNPAVQRRYVQRTYACDSSDNCIYPSWPKTCLTAVLDFGKFAGRVCYHESSTLVCCSRTWDLVQKDARETV